MNEKDVIPNCYELLIINLYLLDSFYHISIVIDETL